MRATATLAAASLLSGCTSTLMLEPKVSVSPYYAVYQLRGAIAMQSDRGPGAPPQINPAVKLGVFGQEHHEDDVGVRAEVGDGFAGFRADYYKLDMTTRQNGILPVGWGELLPDDEVRMRAEMDEVRVSYVKEVAALDTTFREEDLNLRFAAGGEFAYRELVLKARTDDLVRQQQLNIHGETLSLAARVRASWLDLAVDLDYAISPGLAIRGDFGDVGQDIEVRAAYTIPLRDITFFAGFRYSTLEADGRAGPVGYDADLEIDGFQFGMTVSL